MSKMILLASCLFCLSFDSAAAQQPTTTQRDAIRSSCRSDFMAKCSGVEPGGGAALECLERNHDYLSSSCKTAIDAVAAKPAAAPASAETPAGPETVTPAAVGSAPSAEQTPAASQDEQLKAVRRACTLDDIAAHCSWIAPTSPEIVLCLRANATDLSPGCKSAVTGLPAPTATTAPAESAQPVEPTKKPPARAKATSAATPGAPTAAQTAAIRSACRSDFMAHCSGVQPGGSAALQCLASKSAKLSSSCRTAVAALGSPAAGGSVAPPATPATVTPAVAPLTPRPFIMPERRLSVLRICRSEVATLCGGTPPGGGRFIDCLGAHAGALSPACYDAVARVSR